MRALLASCSIVLLSACTNLYLREAEALDIYRDSAPELLKATPDTIDKSYADGADVSGLYLSEINSDYLVYVKPPFRNLLLRVKQQGKKITAFDSTYQMKLDGHIKGNTVEFYTYPSQTTYNVSISGDWKIESDGNLTGHWRAVNNGAIGIWDMRKLDDSGVEFYTTERGRYDPVSLSEADVFFDRLFSRDDDRNIVFFLHGRGANFSDLFEASGVPSIENYSRTRFVILRWLSWADVSIRPYNHAVASANGVADFLYALDYYKSSNSYKLGDRKITLMAHSMGNIPLAAFLKYRYEQGNLQSGLFDSIIFSSADMPFENHRQWIEKCDFSKQIFVTQHRRDYILKLSRYLFSPEEKNSSFKLGTGPDPEDNSHYELLARNASYLDLTGLTFAGHKHFTRDGSLPLFKALLNARKLDYPDPSIGLYRKSERHPVFFFHSSDPDLRENLPDSRQKRVRDETAFPFAR